MLQGSWSCVDPVPTCVVAHVNLHPFLSLKTADKCKWFSEIDCPVGSPCVSRHCTKKSLILYGGAFPDSMVHGGQHGAHLGPTGPRWAPWWPHELCYLGIVQLHIMIVDYNHFSCIHHLFKRYMVQSWQSTFLKNMLYTEENIFSHL